MTKSNHQKSNVIEKIATFIVDKRTLFFLLYIFALVFCVFSMNWVEVENDVTNYLSEDTEIRQGLEAMNRNFVMPGTARIMVSNITLDTAWEIYDTISAADGLAMVTFDGSQTCYKDASALFELNFTGAANDTATIQAMEEIRNSLAGYDFYIDTTIGYDENAMLRSEMLVIGIVAVIIVLIVLTLTSRSYAEIPVLLMTFGAAALLNMGTNFVFGKISFKLI